MPEVPFVGDILDRIAGWIIGFFFDPAQVALQETITQLSSLGTPSLDKWRDIQIETALVAVGIAIFISLIRAGVDMARLKVRKGVVSLLWFAKVYLFGLLLPVAYGGLALLSEAAAKLLPDVTDDRISFEITDMIGAEGAYGAVFAVIFFLVSGLLWLEVVLVREFGLAIAAVLTLIFAFVDWEPLKKLFSKGLAMAILSVIITPLVIAILTLSWLVSEMLGAEMSGASNVLSLDSVVALVAYGLAAYVPLLIIRWAEPRATALVEKVSVNATGGSPGAQPHPPKSLMAGPAGVIGTGIAIGAEGYIDHRIARSSRNSPSQTQNVMKGVATRATGVASKSHPMMGTVASQVMKPKKQDPKPDTEGGGKP